MERDQGLKASVRKAVQGMSARDTIMARVCEALRLPAPMPHMKSHALELSAGLNADGKSSGLTILPLEAATPWLPDGGDTPEEQLALLIDNLEKLRASVYQVPNATVAAEIILRLASERDWKQVAYHGHALVEQLLAGLPCATYRVDSGLETDTITKATLESCDAGITACEAIVSQTGSILVSSSTCGGRSLSILPHVHIVVATHAQIVATLGDALHEAKARHNGRMPSMLSFITGPSRTGDIERILVLGAHGPKELILILLPDTGP